LRASLTQWERKYTADLQAKDAELAQLGVRVKELELLPGQLTDRDRIIRDWDARYAAFVKDHDRAVAKKDEELGKLRAKMQDYAPLPSQVKERDRIIKEWDARYAAAVKSKDGEIAKLSAKLKELEPLPALLKERDRAIADWDVRYSSSVKTKDGEIAKLHTRISKLEPLDAQVREWEAKYAISLKAKEEELAALRGRLSQYEGDLAACSQTVAALEEKLKKPAAPPKDRKDDLVKVYGIGPVLSRQLNEKGVYLFQQIAEWTEADIDHFGSVLTHQFNDRIRRENWVASAKEEHFKKYGEKI